MTPSRPDVAMLVDGIVSAWPLTSVAIDRVIHQFETRTVALLTAEEGAFVLKIDRDPRCERDDTRFEVLAYLEARQFLHAPFVVRTSSGALGAQVADGVACILEYVPHKARSTAGQWAALGTAAARLNAHSDFLRPFAIPLREAIEELRARAGATPFASEMRSILAEVEWIAELPADALVHAEINCANTGLRADGMTVLLDWDQAGLGPAALEYGYPLVTQFIAEKGEHVDIDAARSFYRAYRDGGGTVDQAQCFAASLLHALRYLWWGDTDARWQRIRFAVDHGRTLLGDALR